MQPEIQRLAEDIARQKYPCAYMFRDSEPLVWKSRVIECYETAAFRHNRAGIRQQSARFIISLKQTFGPMKRRIEKYCDDLYERLFTEMMKYPTATAAIIMMGICLAIVALMMAFWIIS